jgi:hypothetical protein
VNKNNGDDLNQKIFLFTRTLPKYLVVVRRGKTKEKEESASFSKPNC